MSQLIVAALVSTWTNFSFNTSDHNKPARDNWLWNSHFQLVRPALQMKYLWVVVFFAAHEEPWNSKSELQRHTSNGVVPLLHNCIWQGIRAEQRFNQSVTFAGGFRNEHSVLLSMRPVIWPQRLLFPFQFIRVSYYFFHVYLIKYIFLQSKFALSLFFVIFKHKMYSTSNQLVLIVHIIYLHINLENHAHSLQQCSSLIL